MGIKATCIECKETFEILVDGELKDYEGSTLDCSKCGLTMIILEGKLENFNDYLKKNYESMGVKVDKEKDYTKDYIEF